MIITYAIMAIIATVLLIGYCALVRKKEPWLLLLYICVTVVNVGYFLISRDPEKFCVKVNKYFQSDETQSMRTNLKGSIFYGKSIERNVERVCEQPAFYQHDGDHEHHEGIV